MFLAGKWLILQTCIGNNQFCLKSEFAKERVKVEGRAAFLKMRIQKQMDTELTNYVDWIFSAGKPSV